MAKTETKTGDDAAIRVIDSVQDAEQSALNAVRKFLEDVNGAFPDVSEESPRRKIIDSAFNMTEQLLRASNQFAEKIVTVIDEALREESDGSASSP